MTTPVSETARRLVILARWRARIGWRGLRRLLVGTLQGRVMILVFVISAPVMTQLMSEGGIPRAHELEASVVMGALVVSHLVLSACFALMVPLALISQFVLDRNAEPLLAHPSSLPELAVLRVGGAILWPSLFLLASFYLFFARSFIEVHDQPAWSLAAHWLSAHAHFIVLGVLASAGLRAYVLSPTRPNRLSFLHRATIAPFLIIYASMAFVPLVMVREAPAILSAIDDLGARTLRLLQFPLVVSGAVAEGSVISLLVATSSLLLAGGWGLRSVWRWAPSAPREVPLDLAVGVQRRYSSRLSHMSRSSGARCPGLYLFWIKDITIPASRDPFSHFGWQALIVVAGSLIVTSLAVVFHSGVIDQAMSVTMHSVVILTTVAIVAMPQTLGCLGKEGPSLALLKPVMSPRHLFLTKWLNALGYTLLHGLAHAAVFTTVAWALGAPIGQPLVFLVEAGAAALAMSAIGTGLGFLVPDLRRERWILPGATEVGKLLFGLVTAGVVSSYGAGRYLLALGQLRAHGFATWTATLSLGVALVAFLLAGWAVRRLAEMEP